MEAAWHIAYADTPGLNNLTCDMILKIYICKRLVIWSSEGLMLNAATSGSSITGQEKLSA